MEGVHDLGGKTGFGQLWLKRDGPVFHEPWEAFGYGLGGIGINILQVFTWDEVRHAIERLEPDHYLAASYYERVLTGVASLFVEKGVVTHGELEQRCGGRFPLSRPVAVRAAQDVPEAGRDSFEVGDRVVVRELYPSGHIRMPAYVRGKEGTVLYVAPPVSFADASAHGLPRRLEATYHVRFDARDLWDDASENSAVVVDLWQSYLVRA